MKCHARVILCRMFNAFLDTVWSGWDIHCEAVKSYERRKFETLLEKVQDFPLSLVDCLESIWTCLLLYAQVCSYITNNEYYHNYMTPFYFNDDRAIYYMSRGSFFCCEYRVILTDNSSNMAWGSRQFLIEKSWSPGNSQILPFQLWLGLTQSHFLHI